MSTRLYTRYEFDADLQSSKPCKDTSWKKCPYPTHNDQERISKMRATQQELKIDWLFHCRWSLWTLQHILWVNVLFCHFCFCQEEQPAPPTEDDIQRRLKTRELFQLRKRFIKEKCYIVVQLIECERWMLCQTDVSKKEHPRDFFRYNCPLVQNQ